MNKIFLLLPILSLVVAVPAAAGSTGISGLYSLDRNCADYYPCTNVSFYLSCTLPGSPQQIEMNVNWGDGAWSYSGPLVNGGVFWPTHTYAGPSSAIPLVYNGAVQCSDPYNPSNTVTASFTMTFYYNNVYGGGGGGSGGHPPKPI